MDKQNLYDLIESYLRKTLDERRLKEMEDQMAEDEVFRAEVEERRKVLNFKSEGLSQVTETGEEGTNPVEAPADESTQQEKEGLTVVKKEKLKYAMLVLALIFAGTQFWLLTTEQSQKSKDTAFSHDEEVEIPVPRPRLEPLFPEEDQDDRFIPNPSFETLIKGGIRSRVLDLEVNSPGENAVFVPNELGRSTIHFRGKALEVDKKISSLFNILIFSNQDVDEAVTSFSFQFKKDKKEQNYFEVSRRVKLDPGIYYFLIQSQEGRQLLYTGKFRIALP